MINYFYINIYYKHIKNDEKLSKLRNDLLRKEYKNLPSYCFFESIDIASESTKERLEWMQSFKNKSTNIVFLVP